MNLKTSEIYFLPLCLILVLNSIDGLENKRPQIAIVGAGIGGASASYFLSELFGNNGADITVYEKGHVGGRLATSKVGNSYYEAGGSALHQKNKYMKEFVKKLGLKDRHVYGIRMGLFDGKKYLIMEGDRSVNSFGTLFHRYGDSLSTWHTVIDDILNRFLRIYNIQKQGYAFTSVDELIGAADPLLANLTQLTAREFLLSKGLLPIFVNEMVTGITRICFGQTPDINAFVGAISLHGAKAGLWGVRGGNDKVPKLLIDSSNSKLILETVTKVRHNRDKKFEIESSTNSGEPIINRRVFDMVIVAAPQVKSLSDIKFESYLGDSKMAPLEGIFHKTVTTLVSGTVNTTFLETKNKEAALDEILTIEDNPLFISLTRIYPVDTDEEWNVSSRVWKVITERPLTEDDLDLIFVERNITVSTKWFAFPRYTPLSKNLGSFVLHPGLFYTSSIEWAASAIEMSAISAKNAALLAYHHWTTKHTDENFVDSYPGFRDEL